MGNLDYNDQTIRAYEEGADDYLVNTPASFNDGHGPMQAWIDAGLDSIPVGGKIFEIGSGGGRDSRYMRGRGFDVQCTDAAQVFVDYLLEHGEKALKLNILAEEIHGKYDMAYANSVMPHFNKHDLELVLKKVHNALNGGGVFVFSIKRGDGEVWINEKLQAKRYVHYWQPEEIKKVTEQAGYRITYFKTDIVGHLPNHDWIVIVAQKPE